MFGIINRFFIEELTHLYSIEKLDSVFNRLGVDKTNFSSYEAYPDRITFTIIQEAAKELGLKTDELLTSVGQRFVFYTEKDTFGYFYKEHEDAISFLRHLNGVHNAVAMSFDNLRAPIFILQDISVSKKHLKYQSHRVGLTAFVTGALEGLFKYYNQKVEISLISSREQNGNYDIFELELR